MAAMESLSLQWGENDDGRGCLLACALDSEPSEPGGLGVRNHGARPESWDPDMGLLGPSKGHIKLADTSRWG